jgi:hypothetical protein
MVRLATLHCEDEVSIPHPEGNTITLVEER